VRVTPSFVLWKRTDQHPPIDRQVLAEGDHPGRTLRYVFDRGSPGGSATIFPRKPITGSNWSAGPTVESGSTTSQTLRVPAGTWNVSIQYDASRPLDVSAPGLTSTGVPANLDYRGTTPYYAAGTLEASRSGPVTFTVGVEDPPLIGRLLGANSVAHLGSLALTPFGGEVGPGAGERVIPVKRAVGRYVDWFR
jgi:hypothetical protein